MRPKKDLQMYEHIPVFWWSRWLDGHWWVGQDFPCLISYLLLTTITEFPLPTSRFKSSNVPTEYHTLVIFLTGNPD